MVNARDLVEARAFARRRLVAALVAGTTGPGEPPTTVRRVFTGTVLALFAVAGAGLTGWLGR